MKKVIQNKEIRKKYYLAIGIIMFMLFILLIGNNVKAESENVISIGDNQYPDIQTAVASAQAGDTITLLKDIDFTQYSYVANLPDNVTLDMNGHKIIIGYMGLIFTGNGLTIKNGTFESSTSYSLWIGDNADTDNVIVENVSTVGGINIFNATNVVLRNVNAVGNDYYAVWGDEHTEITIESGNYSTHGIYGLLGKFNNIEPVFVIKGGTFTTNDGKLLCGGSYEPIIYGGTFNCDVTEYKAEGVSIAQNTDGNYIVGYKITVSDYDTKKGNVEVLDNVATAGKEVKITCNSNKGYKVKSVSVADSNGNKITVSKDNTFVMPESNVTIQVSFEEVSTEVVAPEVDVTKPSEEVKAGISDKQKTEDTLLKTLEEMIKKDPTLAEKVSNKDLKVQVEVNNKAETTNEVKAKIEEAIKKLGNDAKVAQYFNIEVTVKADDTKITKLSELTGAIQLIVTLPEDLQKVEDGYDRTYYIIREHGGKVETLEATLSEDGTYLTFESDKFSTFALAYLDKKIEDDEKDNVQDNNNQNNDNGQNSESEKIEDNNTNNVSTGDNVIIYVITLIASIAGIYGLIILRKRYTSKKH